MDIIQSAIENQKHISKYMFRNKQTWDVFQKKSVGKDIYLYGLGKAAKYFIKEYSNKIKICGVIDKYVNLQGFLMGDYLPEAVETPCEQVPIFDTDIFPLLDSKKTLILISNINGYEKIAEQISSYHIECFVLLLMEADKCIDIGKNMTEEQVDLKTVRLNYARKCCCLPIDRKKIVFMIGKYGGHAKYITRALIEKKCNLDIVWLVGDLRVERPKEVRLVYIGNWKKYIYEMETAKAWVFDVLVPEFIKKREGQIYIQAKHWASVTLKKFFLDDISTTNTAYQIEQVKRNSQMMDYIFVGSDFDRDTCKSGFAFYGKFVSVGSPRSDAVFHEENKTKIYEKYHIASKAYTVLYAPTFRYNVRDRRKSMIQGLSFVKLHEKLVRAFGGEWYILLRRHPSLTNIVDDNFEDDNVIDVSGHDDSQELAAACDVLISDYSSIMFEPAFVRKPVLLFAPDRKQYVGEERELLIEYETLPFPIAETNEDLWNIIEYFNYDEYRGNVDRFMQKYDVHEDGHASERAAAFIMNSVMYECKVSVIIPIYNTAFYLPRCIESIINQTYQNIEIILVDDGSTDNSAEICKKYAMKDSRIILIRQENRGNNAARKAGLKASTGEYVMFVDSDDWVGNDLITLLYLQAAECNVDLVISNVLKTRVNGKEEERRNLINTGVYSNPKEVVKRLFFDYEDCEYGILPYIFAKLYQRNLIIDSMQKLDDRIQYDEDRALVWTCLMQDITVSFVDDMEYYYCQREDGLVCNNDEMYLAKVNYFYCYMKQLFEKEDEILRKQLERYVIWNVQIAFKWKMGMSENALEKVKEKYVLDSTIFMDRPIKVVLYGAGAVGVDYDVQLRDSQNIQLVAWVDRDWEERRRKGLEVQSVEMALHLSYDYILVAVKRIEIFNEIKTELILKGFTEDTILWGKPYGA